MWHLTKVNIVYSNIFYSLIHTGSAPNVPCLVPCFAHAAEIFFGLLSQTEIDFSTELGFRRGIIALSYDIWQPRVLFMHEAHCIYI